MFHSMKKTQHQAHIGNKRKRKRDMEGKQFVVVIVIVIVIAVDVVIVTAAYFLSAHIYTTL